MALHDVDVLVEVAAEEQADGWNMDIGTINWIAADRR